uniref:Glutamate receptor 1 n=1 Tax=Panagrellus redivivus TaxID=6233 RepID=A0A7E4V259_PANRE
MQLHSILLVAAVFLPILVRLHVSLLRLLLRRLQVRRCKPRCRWICDYDEVALTFDPSQLVPGRRRLPHALFHRNQRVGRRRRIHPYVLDDLNANSVQQSSTLLGRSFASLLVPSVIQWYRLIGCQGRLNRKIGGFMANCFIEDMVTGISCPQGYEEKKRLLKKSFTTPNDREQGVITALNYTVNRINSGTHLLFYLAYRNKALRHASSDTWGVMKKICAELESGFLMMLSGDSSRTHEAYASVASSVEVPVINWDVLPLPLLENMVSNFEVSVRPSNAELIADLIIIKGWKNFIYVHDAQRLGALNLETIYQFLRKKTNESITSELIQLPTEVDEYPEFLRTFSLQRFLSKSLNRIILDAENSYRQQQLLSAIRSAQFNQANYHYIVANFDFLPYDVEMYQNGNINITGFQIINRELREYSALKHAIDQSKHVDRTEKHSDMDTRLAFAHDAVLVAQKAFEIALKKNDSIFHQNFRHGELYNRDLPGIYCYPNNDKENPQRTFVTFEHGRTLSRALHNVKLKPADGTLTGNIEFDRNGLRKNYFVKVIDLVSNAKSAFNKKEIFAWMQGEGFITNQTVAQHSRKPQGDANAKKKVRVVSVLVEPFVMIKRDCEKSNASGCQGNERFEGYCIDLLKLLSDRIEDFDYEIFISAVYGAKQPDGSWDGLIGYLLRGDADVAVASLTINQDRERVVDFSKPYMTTGISIMIKKPDKQEFSVFSFMQPLSSEIWMYIFFAYVGVSVVIFLVSRFSPYEWRVEEMANGGFTISNDFSVYNCLWFTLAAFMQQGTDILPRSISGRIASSAWWFFTMIIVSSYTANLAAFLTLEKMQAPIESVEDLAKQTKIKYGIQQGGSTAQFFKHSSVQIYQRMWRFMESQVPPVFTSSYAEGIERVRNHKGRYAFLLEATANEYANTRKPCDTMKVGANLNSVGYGVATPFGSEWKDLINLAILALQERGELKKLENKWWYDRGQCDPALTDGSSASLNLSKVAGIFYILMGGMILSMFAALGEFIYRSRIEARKGQISSVKDLRESFYGQLKLSLQGGAVAKEGSSAHEALKFQKASSCLPASYNDTPLSPSSSLASGPQGPRKRKEKDAQNNYNSELKRPTVVNRSSFNTAV